MLELFYMDYRYITIVYTFTNQSLFVIHYSLFIRSKIVDFVRETTTILVTFYYVKIKA